MTATSFLSLVIAVLILLLGLGILAFGAGAPRGRRGPILTGGGLIALGALLQGVGYLPQIIPSSEMQLGDLTVVSLLLFLPWLVLTVGLILLVIGLTKRPPVQSSPPGQEAHPGHGYPPQGHQPPTAH